MKFLSSPFFFPVRCASPSKCAVCSIDFQSLFKHSFKSVLLNWDNHIKIESVIGFPEAQNKEETEQTRPGKAPVEPRQLCKTKTCSCKHSCVTSRTPPVCCWEQPALHSKALIINVPWEAWKPAFNKQWQMWSLSDACNMLQGFPVEYF